MASEVTPERWQQIREVFYRALSLRAEERGAYLDAVCSADAELLSEVESLLSSDQQAGAGFMSTPVVDLTHLQPSTAPTRVGRRIGAYNIVEEIGHGGMGEVYRAGRADGQYQKEVAIKLVRGGYDTASLLERFRHERQILASLDQPNIARLLDGGTTDEGIPYLVMELIDGISIDQYCDTYALNVSERLPLFLQVCSAVQYAHQRLVIHRDIKPGNILVTREGVPKLLDFGIAKILDPASSSEATVVSPMTPEYASPEQIRGEPITTATDVYSLGVVLYELLASRSPYPANTRTPHEFARAICEFEPERPSIAVMKRSMKESNEFTVVGSPPAPEKPRNWSESARARFARRVRGDLDVIVLKALRKEPQRRYASVEQFAEDIRRHLEGLPVTARRDSWKYRTGKFATRHKLGVAATALIVVAVLGGVAATVREARIAAANERRAEQRFNDVRKLANSLMYEIHDSIEGLPGATPARKLIVQRSLEYLNGLSREAAEEASLQRELADAYERTGLVQGDPNGTNLGDIAGARDSFAKALSIREKLSKTSTRSGDILALAASYREMCAIKARYLGNIGSALQDCRQAVTKAEELYKAEPSNPLVKAELAKAYDATGTVYGQGSTSGNAGDFYAALESHREALDLVAALTAERPHDPDLSNWQGKLSLSTADDLFEIGQVSKAVPLYTQATSTFENLTKQSNKISYVDSLGLAYQRMGDMLLVAGHFEQALTYYRKTMDVCTELVAADPKSMAYRTSLAASRATYGNAMWRAGHMAEGIASFKRGLAELAETRQQDARAVGLDTVTRLWLAGALEKQHDIGGALHNYSLVRDYYVRICQSDPKDVEDCLSLAGTLDRIGNVHIQQGLLEAALGEYQKALEISERLSAGERPNLEALYTVVNVYFGLGKVYASLSRTSAASAKRIELTKQSCSWFQKSYAAYQRIPEWIPITPNEFDSRDPNEIAAQLGSCRLFPHAGDVGLMQETNGVFDGAAFESVTLHPNGRYGS